MWGYGQNSSDVVFQNYHKMKDQNLFPFAENAIIRSTPVNYQADYAVSEINTYTIETKLETLIAYSDVIELDKTSLFIQYNIIVKYKLAYKF